MKESGMLWQKGGCSVQSRQSQDFRYDCENFVGIAEISQS